MVQVVDVGSSELVHTFTPCCEEHDEEMPPSEPPITRMYTSSDGQWLAAINCFGDVHIFNLEIQRCETALWFSSINSGHSFVMMLHTRCLNRVFISNLIVGFIYTYIDKS